MHDENPLVSRPGHAALDAWQLVQLRHLASDASEVAARVERQLGPIDIDCLRIGASLELSAAACNDAADDVLALHDIAAAMEQIAGMFRLRDEPLRITATDVEDEAAAALACGSADPAYVKLAARLLRIRPGLAALAYAIECDPAMWSQWNELTVGELLAAFRDSDDRLLAAACQSAGVDAEARWSQLDLDTIERLAATFRTIADA